MLDYAQIHIFDAVITCDRFSRTVYYAPSYAKCSHLLHKLDCYYCCHLRSQDELEIYRLM